MNQNDAEKEIKQRVLDVLNECKISVNKLALTFGASTRTWNDQINGSSKISAATLVALANFRPDISAEWLLRGSGSMLISEQQHETLTGQIRDDSETIAALKLTIEKMQRTIDNQDREIEGLLERIKELKGDIAVPHRSVATA